MKKITLATIILLFVASSAYAEPNNSIKYLMSEPYTLFDMGLTKLEEKVKRLIERQKINNVKYINAYYNFDSDKITILINGDAEKPTHSTIPRKEWCETTINQIKESLIFDTEGPTGDKATLINWKYFPLISAFSHKGYRVTRQPNNLGEEIAKILEVRAVREKLLCQSMLEEKNIYCNELGQKTGD